MYLENDNGAGLVIRFLLFNSFITIEVHSESKFIDCFKLPKKNILITIIFKLVEKSKVYIAVEWNHLLHCANSKISTEKVLHMYAH
jgi:hypothetical protein